MDFDMLFITPVGVLFVVGDKGADLAQTYALHLLPRSSFGSQDCSPMN